MVTVERFLFDTEFAPGETAAKAEAIPDEAFVLDHFSATGEPVEQPEAVAVPEAPPPPPPPPPPTYSEEELEAARNEAFTEGHEIAMQQARKAQEEKLAEVVEQMTKAMQALFTARQQESTEVMSQVTQLSLSIIYKLFPAMSARNAAAEIERMLSDCMQRLPEEPKLSVRVHAGLSQALNARLSALIEQTGFMGRIQLTPDPQMPPGDCLVEWAEGGAERNQASLLNEIESLLTHAVPAATPHKTETTPTVEEIKATGVIDTNVNETDPDEPVVPDSDTTPAP